MKKSKLEPSNFTKTIGAYSHGISVTIEKADIIFVTGQIAMDENGNVVEKNNPSGQAEFVFRNIDMILKEGGGSLEDVVKAQIFLTNMDDFAEISKVRNKFFLKSKPVSTLVEVNKLVKEGCCVEIEVIAIVNKQL